MANADQGPAKYTQTQIATASREQLVVLLYNGALKFLSDARTAMQRRDIPRQAERIHRAQDVLAELMSSLNMEEGGEIAANLFRLYAFFFDQLTEASVHDNLQALESVYQHMRILRDAFQEAERATTVPTPLARGA